MPSTPRAARNVNQTRDELLAAGAHLLASDPSHAFGVLRASHVARQAGRTTGAFFNIWPTQEAYLDDLVDHVLSPERGTTGLAVGKLVAEAQRSGADEDTCLLAIAAVVLEEVPNDPQTVLELLLWSRAHGDSGLRLHLAERYRILRHDAGRAGSSRSTSRSTGRRLRRGSSTPHSSRRPSRTSARSWRCAVHRSPAPTPPSTWPRSTGSSWST